MVRVVSLFICLCLASTNVIHTSGELAANANNWFVHNLKALVKSGMIRICTFLKVYVGISCGNKTEHC